MTLSTGAITSAIQAGDVEGFLALCRDDAVLHSPVSNRVTLRGRDTLRGALRALFATLEGVECMAEVGAGSTQVVSTRANVDSQSTQQVFWLELDDQGRVRDVTLFVRPLPGVAALAARVAPQIARRYGPVPSRLARMTFRPIAVGTRVAEQFVRMLAWRARSQP